MLPTPAPRRLVMVCGTFDLLHPGHMFVIDEARRRGRAVVIVARDSNVAALKGAAPIHSETERLHAIRSERPDVDVRLGDEKDFMQPIRDIAPDLLLLGYDQHLPPGVSMHDLPCSVERLDAFHPTIHKTSVLRSKL